MKYTRNLLLIITIIGGLQACNTLYSYNLIDIEVAEPGKILLPERYSKAAIAYNNILDYIPNNDTYFYNRQPYQDTLNLDSISAKVYFSSSVENLNKQFYFDSIIELPFHGNSGYCFSDSLVRIHEVDTSKIEEYVLFPSISMLSNIISENQAPLKNNCELRFLDPKLGLYTQNELKQIADSTHADILISLDYFSSVDIKSTQKLAANLYYSDVSVYSMGLWNFYNLKTGAPGFYYNQFDTLMWTNEDEFKEFSERTLPPRKDAVLNAADIMGIRLTEKLIPHWTQVQRLYYTSGHVELRKTNQLVKAGKWIDAAEIWKANINNPNKNIAAKSMYNLGVACEMQGDIDAAIDWVVRSFQVFGSKNQVHYLNCTDYIRILGKRKIDLKLINQQLQSST